MSDPEQPTPLAWSDRLDLLTSTPQLNPARVATAVAAVVAVLGVGWFALRPPTGPPPESLLPIAGTAAEPSTSTTTTAPAFVLAHAAGAVARPGVYRLSAGSRVTDLVDAAGGPTADADLDRLNLAATIADGERVYVPRVGEVVASAVSTGAAAGDAAGPLDLNAATLEQLDTLPGIGPATAQAIIDERDRRGGFRSVDDLLDVRGIGPAKLEQIRPLVTV